MLRIAVPNKGSLAEPAAEMLREAGYRQRTDAKDLVCRRPRQRRRVLLPAPARHRDLRRLRRPRRRHHRPRPAARLRRAGRGDPRRSASARSTFRFAARPGHGRPTSADLAGHADRHRRTRAWSRGYLAEPRHRRRRWSGSTARSRPPSSSASPTSIADVVETGTTLRQAGLEIFGEPILQSRGGADPPRRAPTESPAVDQLRAPAAGRPGRPPLRDDGLRHARPSCSRRRSRSRPGIESPTVSPLHREGWVAVRAMVPRAEAHRIMDELYDLGARGILVTDIHACRL